MNQLRVIVGSLAAAALLVISSPATAAYPQADGERAHEVWVIDQSDSVPDGGGTLHIYPGSALVGPRAEAAVAEVIDLGADARDLCMADTGMAPRRPHMLLFNADQSHAILAFVATGHVLFLDAAARWPVACIKVGAQAHAAFPSPDQRYVVVANQNGKLLQRIRTDYPSSTFTLESTATIDLAACRTPSGAGCQDPNRRPDNAPICPVIDSSSRFTFVTLRGGGLLVVDSSASPTMRIVAEYDRSTVRPNGCGGLETGGKMYINSGGGTPATPLGSDLYRFQLTGFSANPNPPNAPTPRVVFSQRAQGFVDSHGASLIGDGPFLWVGDRAANKIVVVDTATDSVSGEIDLSGAGINRTTPDLLDVAPDGSRVYLSLRGPEPLTANAPGINNAVGFYPGLGIVTVLEDGRTGELEAIVRISREVDGAEKADPHGMRVRHLSR